MKNRLVNLCLFFVSAILMLLICEAIFRYLIPQPYRVRNVEFYSSMQQSDKEIGYTLKPNIRTEHFNTNSYGFRGPEPAPGRMNILCVGDSHTFGWDVYDEFTYPQQLQGLVGDRYNVINMGAGGYNIISEAGILNRYLDKLRPKVVIFGVVVDDVTDGIPDLPVGQIHRESPKSYREILQASAMVRYIKDTLPGMQIKLGLRKAAHEEYYQHWTNRKYLDLYKSKIGEELDRLSKLQAKVIFVIFPFPSEVYLMNRTERPNVSLFRNLESKDVKYIDLLPVFQANYKKVSTLYLEDGHPNEYAYRLVAREIFKKLKETYFIDVKDN
jgi:lysophospholipase L1-like esterase